MVSYSDPHLTGTTRVGKLNSYNHPVHDLLMHGLKMTRPGRAYLAAISHPFYCGVHEHKVPLGGSTTQAVTTRLSFEFSAGINGNAFVSCKPNVQGKDAVQFSTNAFVQIVPGLPFSTSAALGVAGAALPKPYTFAQISQQVGGDGAMQYRLVSAGLRIHYVGSELNRSGTAYSLTSQRNDDISGLQVAQMYSSTPEVIKTPMSEASTIEVTWHAKSDDQLRLIDAFTSGLEYNVGFPSVHTTTLQWDYTSASLSSVGTSFAIALGGCVPSSAFTAEYIEHWEFAGINVGMLATHTPGDLASIGTAHSIMSGTLTSLSANGGGDRTEHMAQTVVDLVKAYEPDLIAAGGAVFGPEAIPVLATAAKVINSSGTGISKVIGGIAAGIRRLFGIH